MVQLDVRGRGRAGTLVALDGGVALPLLTASELVVVQVHFPVKIERRHGNVAILIKLHGIRVLRIVPVAQENEEGRGSKGRNGRDGRYSLGRQIQATRASMMK